ncbi:hypothetical protein [Paenibacillus alkalitolerans]|nr:hypothetical protein [Paenibacillus alkalitolerans]
MNIRKLNLSQTKITQEESSKKKLQMKSVGRQENGPIQTRLIRGLSYL